MLAALAWIPRGHAKAKLPEGVDDSAQPDHMDLIPDSDTSHPPSDLHMTPAALPQDETKTDPRSKDHQRASDDDNDHEEEEEEEEEENDDDDEQSEVDIDEVLANDLDALSFHKPGEKDPYLQSDPQADALFDDDDLEALEIKSTDALIVTVKSGEDASSLVVHLFDDDPEHSDDEDDQNSTSKSTPYIPHHYIHHDIVLPALPLCAAYTHIQPSDETVNLVAVGMFTPGIVIWDIDRVNNLDPVATLGGYEPNHHLEPALSAATSMTRGKKKKKKKPKLRLRDDSHANAVMALSWNQVQREYLASGSSDTTVKIWDIESTHCATTLRHHSGEVQSVDFHPSEAHLLISGSFDRTVQLADVRDPSTKTAWTVSGDVEVCQWGSGASAGLVFATAEDGHVTVFDPRNSAAQSKLADWVAHMGPASACSVSSDVSGLMVTGGVDKMIKVWDVSEVRTGNPGQLVYERASRAGALFALSLCPLSEKGSSASPFVIGFGGPKGVVGVTDLAVESDAVRKRFGQKCSPQALKVIESRAARGIRQMNARTPKKKDAEEDSCGDEEVNVQSADESE